MSIRLNYFDAAPGAINNLLNQERYLSDLCHKGELDKPLIELIKTRVSQINGCAYCLDMHTKDARANGETEQRLYALNAWRETPFFTERERAALSWAEALTSVTTQHPDEDLLDSVREHFSDAELTNLTLAICAINSWNRFAIGFGAEVGSYEVGMYD